MVSLVQQSKKQSAESRHAGGQYHTILSALQGRDALLKRFLVGASVSGIEISAGAGPVHICRVVGQGVAVGHGNRTFDGSAVLVYFIAGMNGPGGKPIGIFSGFF